VEVSGPVTPTLVGGKSGEAGLEMKDRAAALGYRTLESESRDRERV
jgi:hypothetical protein